MDIYTVKDTDIVHETSVDFITRECSKEIHIVQYDDSQPIIAVSLRANSEKYSLPDGYEANIRFGKKDKTFVYKAVLGCNDDRSVVYFSVDKQMSLIYGKVNPIIEITYGGAIVGSSSIPFYIDRNPIQIGDIESKSDYPAIIERISAAETKASAAQTAANDAKKKVDGVMDDYYTNTQVDSKISDASAAADSKISALSSSVDTKISTVSSDIDSKISDLDSKVVHKTGVETISGQKTFNDILTVKSDKYIKTNEIDNTSGNALVRFKSTEGKNVFGGIGYDNVLMGKSTRPYYSKDGSDFSGTELALKSDVDNITVDVDEIKATADAAKTTANTAKATADAAATKVDGILDNYYTNTEIDTKFSKVMHLTGDETAAGYKTFSDAIAVNQINGVAGGALARYRVSEGKTVFGNANSNAVIMGSADRPYYSNNGTDYKGVELALKRDVESKFDVDITDGALLVWNATDSRIDESKNLLLSDTYVAATDVTASVIKRPYADGNGFYQSMVNNVRIDDKDSDYQYRMNFDNGADKAYADLHLSATGSVYAAVTGDNAAININVKGNDALLYAQLDGYSILRLMANGDEDKRSLNYVYLTSDYNDQPLTGAPLLFLYNRNQEKANQYGLGFDCSRNQLGYVTKDDDGIHFNDMNYLPRLDTDGEHVYYHNGTTQGEMLATALPTPNSVVYRAFDGNFCSATPTAGEHVVNKNYVDGRFVTLSTEQTISGIKHFNSGNKTYDNAVFYNDDTYFLKPTYIRINNTDNRNIACSADETVFEKKTTIKAGNTTNANVVYYEDETVFENGKPVTLQGDTLIQAGGTSLHNLSAYTNDTILEKPTVIKAGGGDSVNINAGTSDTYFGKPVTIDAYLKTNEIDNTSGNALVRYKSAEAKNVFGGVNYDAVIMGKGDRPYYSKDGSDFTGVELALKSDLDNIQIDGGVLNTRYLRLDGTNAMTGNFVLKDAVTIDAYDATNTTKSSIVHVINDDKPRVVFGSRSYNAYLNGKDDRPYYMSPTNTVGLKLALLKDVPSLKKYCHTIFMYMILGGVYSSSDTVRFAVSFSVMSDYGERLDSLSELSKLNVTGKYVCSGWISTDSKTMMPALYVQTYLTSPDTGGIFFFNTDTEKSLSFVQISSAMATLSTDFEDTISYI